MTVSEFSKKYELKPLSLGSDCEIQGGFTGDLLSWVMSNAQENTAWFTVMGNINAIAVASLNEIACIVLCQGSNIMPDALNKAKEEGINIFSTPKSCFEMCGLLYGDLKN